MNILDAYLAGPGDLRAAVAGLSPEQLVVRPVPGRWSVLEVVCHLADTDANIAHRIKRVLSEERPVFDRFKPDLMLAALAYHERDVEEELAFIDLGRKQIARILRALPTVAWERVGVVGDRGDKTVAQMVNGAVEHVTYHSSSRSDGRWSWGERGPAEKGDGDNYFDSKPISPNANGVES